MRTRDRVSQVILILAALLSAAWAIRNLLEVWEPFSGSAEIGAVSVGVPELKLGVVPIIVVAGLLINRRVATAARRQSRLADRFRRTYLWLMAGYVVWSVGAITWLTLANGQGVTTFYVAMMGTFMVVGTFFPLQLFFASALVAFMIGHPTASPPLE